MICVKDAGPGPLQSAKDTEGAAMTYKTIMVSLNEIGRLPQLIEAAAFLGQTFKAHISGLYVIPAVQVYPSVGFEAGPRRSRATASISRRTPTKLKPLSRRR